MAKESLKKIEREYIIPIRKYVLKTPYYKRTAKSIKIIKEFIAKHMKVVDRDVSKVRIDKYLNNEIWFRGRRSPPSKIKVKATKEGETVRVDFSEMPEHVKFSKSKAEKFHRQAEKKPGEKKEEPKIESKPEEKKPEKEKEEKEKETATAEQHAKEAKMDAKTQKHLTKPKEPGYHRMALKK